MEKKEVGKITHFFDHINVAVVELKTGLKVGETISIEGRDSAFEQKVESMQLEHEPLKVAKKGQAIGMKVSQPVKPGYVVYKVSK